MKVIVVLIALWLPLTTCLAVSVSVSADSCDFWTCDADGSGSCDIDDTVYLIVYIFLLGAPPTPYAVASGDPNCDCQVDIDDALYGIVYIFEGREPCSCEEWQLSCGPLR
jgi:hypothetical protein